jgi:hypothetical protein
MPRARLNTPGGRTTARSLPVLRLAGTNTRHVRSPLRVLFGAAVGKATKPINQPIDLAA